MSKSDGGLGEHETVAEGTAAPEASPSPVLGDRYVLIESIGTGGMGEVWRGFDLQLERPVALKFLRRHSDLDPGDASVVREARAMARLSHPNVLPVFDVVRGDRGTFIVMELVHGCTLRQWLEPRDRPLPEILTVFAAAARGLHAAHVAGFVHRDFKPSNVMVADDAQLTLAARVRVMDFGLAREDRTAAAPRQLAAASLAGIQHGATTAGSLAMGTPAYMAPEQREGGVVDARSDQYSFCVSLYEAVLGRRPGPDPVPPALDTLPVWLSMLLLQGLSPDPSRRHPSMAALAETIEAHVDRRVPRALAVGGAAVGVLGLVALVWTMQREGARAGTHTRCNDEAEAIVEVWGPPQRAAVEASLRATGVIYAERLFERVAPWLDRYALEWSRVRTDVCMAETSALPREPAVDCLDEASAELAALVDQLAHADAETAAHAVTSAAGLPPLARCADPVALARRPALPRDQDQRASILRAHGELAAATALADSGHPAAASTRVDAVATEATALGYAPLQANVHATRGHIAQEHGDAAEAARELEQAFHIARAVHADGIAADAAIDLVFVTGRQRSAFDEGLLWGEVADALLERDAGDDDPRWGSLYNNLGLVRLARGDHDEGLAHLQRAVELTEAAMGTEHPWLATPINNLGLAFAELGDYRRAIEHYERALAILETNLGPENPELAMPLHNRGSAHVEQGDLEQGRRDNDRALALWLPSVGPEHTNVAMVLNSIGDIQLQQDDRRGAIASFERALAIWRKKLGPDDPAVATGLNNVGAVYFQLREFAPAEQYFAEALALRERVLAPTHVDIVDSLLNLAALRLEQERPQEARAFALRALSLQDAESSSGAHRLARTLRTIGRAALEAGDAREAVTQLERAHALEVDGALAADRASTDFALARALWVGGGTRERTLLDPRERERALELARAAADAHAPGSPARERIERWVRERDPS